MSIVNWLLWTTTVTIAPLAGKTPEARQKKPTLATYLLLRALAPFADPQGVVRGLCARELAFRCGISRATAVRQLAFLRDLHLIAIIKSRWPDGSTAPATIVLNAADNPIAAMLQRDARMHGGRITVAWNRRTDDTGLAQLEPGLMQGAVPLLGTDATQYEAGLAHGRHKRESPPLAQVESAPRAYSLSSFSNSYKDGEDDARAGNAQSEVAALIEDIATFLNQRLAKFGQQLTLALHWSGTSGSSPSAETAKPEAPILPAALPGPSSTVTRTTASRTSTTTASPTVVSEDLITEMVEAYRDRLSAEYVRGAIAKCQRFGGRKLAEAPKERLVEWLDHDLEMGVGERPQARTSGSRSSGKRNPFAVHHAQPDPDFIHPFASLYPERFGRRDA